MARLCGYLDLTPETPGFLTPVFQPYAGANHLVTQIIDEEDRVIGFREISPPAALVRSDWSDESVEIGDHALWSFRLPNNAEALGPAYEIRPTLVAWLLEGALKGWPLIAMEVAGFCGGAKLQCDHVQAGYESLRRNSDVTADVWLTTQVFLPAARRDLARSLAVVGAALPRAVDVEIVEDRVEVRTTATIPSGPVFGELRSLANAMGLREIALMVRHDEPKHVDLPLHAWIAGLGGVGRYVIKKLNLPGYHLAPPLPSGTIGVVDSSHLRHLAGLFIGVLQGDPRHLPAMATLAEKHSRPGTLRHLIQVRPFGYYPVQAIRSTIEEVAASEINADIVWIVSQHRRERPVVEHRLTAADHASRTVTLLVDIIIELGDEWLGYVRTPKTRRSPFFGLVGVTRYAPTDAIDQLLRKAVHDLLSEDFVLSSAKAIQVFLPRGWTKLGLRQIQLGPQTYRVELLPHPEPNRRKLVASLALDVSRSNGSPDYAAFCHGLLAAYGWRFDLSKADADTVRIVTLGEMRLGVRCYLHATDLLRALPIGAPLNYDLLICAERINDSDREDAHADGMTAIHHSDLARWHWHELGIEAFGTHDTSKADIYGFLQA
jgi:hypothetical protein